MDPREKAFREYLIEKLDEARKKFPEGYMAFGFDLNSHNDVINGGIHAPAFECSVYFTPDGTMEHSKSLEGENMGDVISKLNQ